jgi:hypothetical protein
MKLKKKEIFGVIVTKSGSLTVAIGTVYSSMTLVAVCSHELLSVNTNALGCACAARIG